MMTKALSVSDPICIGIIGGGQLGKMIAQQANRMSFKVAVLDPSKDCPASAEAKDLIIADFKNDAAILRLAKMCDVITYEIELASSRSLLQLESDGFPVYPSPKILSVIQDKFKQKSFLKAQRVPIPICSS
jgi:5-(carboxyamino)imidazole ribonucleotide synthase